MNLRVLLATVLLASIARAAEPATKPASKPAPVAAVWYQQSGMTIPKPGEVFEPNRLIVGVWGDGTVVWSDDRRTGGKPYWTARVPQTLVDTMLASLGAVGFFEPSKISGFGPDASITAIAAQAGDRRQWRGSWHQPTTRPTLVFSEHGIASCPPGEVMKKPSPEYQRFLDVWAESRRLIESVVPENQGRPLETLDKQIFRTGR